MSNFLRKKRAEWSDFSDELLEESDDSMQTACGWRSGNTVGKASVSVGKRRTTTNLDKNSFCLKQNELAEVQYQDPELNAASFTARNRLLEKRMSYVHKPSDCLNVSDSDMSLAITHGSSMGTYRTIPTHMANRYNVSARSLQTGSPYFGHRMQKKIGFENSYALPQHKTFQNMNGSRDINKEITEKDVSRLIEAVKTKSLSPAKIQLLQKVLDSTTGRSLVSEKRHSKVIRPARVSSLKRRINKLYQAEKKSFNTRSDSSDLSSTETDCSDKMVRTLRPLRDDNIKRHSTRLTNFQLPTNRLGRKFEDRVKPLSTYDLRNDILSNGAMECDRQNISAAQSNCTSINEKSVIPKHRSTMPNMDCANLLSMTTTSMRPSFIRRKLFSQCQEYIANGDENSFGGRGVAPNIYANNEEDSTRRSFRRSFHPRYSRNRQSSNTDHFQSKYQLNSNKGRNMTPVLKHLIGKCNTTGLGNNYLHCLKQQNTAASCEEFVNAISAGSPINRPTDQPLGKKLTLTPEGDHLTDVNDDPDNSRTELNIDDRFVEPNFQPHIDSDSTTKVSGKNPNVIIPCYVYIREGDIRNVDSFKKMNLGCENNNQDSLPIKGNMAIVKNVRNLPKSSCKSKRKSKDFENIESSTESKIIDVTKTSRSLMKLTRLSKAKLRESINSQLSSAETSDNDIILNNSRNKKKKGQQSRIISKKAVSPTNSGKIQNCYAYFLRPKTVINKCDLTHESNINGKKLDTSEQRISQNSSGRVDEKLVKNDKNKNNKNSSKAKVNQSDRSQMSTGAHENEICLLENVKSKRKKRCSQSVSNQEISPTCEVLGQLNIGLRRSARKRIEPMIYWKNQRFSCHEGNMNSGENTADQDTKEMRSNSNKTSTASKVNQSNRFWNLSGSSSEEEELNKKTNQSSDERVPHYVPKFSNQLGTLVKEVVQVGSWDTPVNMVSVKHNSENVLAEQHLCSNIKENQNISNIHTQRCAQVATVNEQKSGTSPNFPHRIVSRRAVTRNTTFDIENFLVPVTTMEFKEANRVNDKCSSVIEFNTKTRSSLRYGKFNEEKKFFNEDDGCCSVISFKSVRTRKRKVRFVHFF